MTTSIIKTRFAPSPTGNLHIGGARTALYSYLWAKKMGGEFLLRIEDTDRTRYQATAEESIFSGLKWLGLNWDGEVLYQSKRTELYKQHIDKLLASKKAYYCFCTPERLQLMREIQQKKQRAPKYDKTCLHLSKAEIEEKLTNKEPYVVRLNVPDQGEIIVQDLVRGKITFQCQDIDDQILLKSDGFPTYHLANVVDDYASGITHVIRGEEWIPSTPKHVLLYRAFGWDTPQFAHLSLFIKKGGGKLSKREGATALLEYKAQGYLPEAVVNFIAMLGWNPKSTQEMFNLEQLIQQFDLNQVHTANPIFDTIKLDWYNNQYIKQYTTIQLTELCRPYLDKQNIVNAPLHTVEKIIALEQPRLKKLSDIKNETDFFFTETLNYPATLLLWKKNTPAQTKIYLTALANYLAQNNNDEIWSNQKTLETNIITWIKTAGYNNGDILWPLRVALTGKPASPSPFEVASILGKTKTLQRIYAAITLLQS
ncbi:MAG: glutamate--tRNA ligase [Patescibacteria group bacterium]|jgi:glutamyl-tRNA synthetase